MGLHVYMWLQGIIRVCVCMCMCVYVCVCGV